MYTVTDRADRSVPRTRLRQGDHSRDARGRVRGGPAILQYGFRPFFLLGALHAALAVPLWIWMLVSGAAPNGRFAAMEWHAHEMLFGYLAAIVAGFVLTAVPNWTGRLPLSGWPLAGLVALWLMGRLAAGLVAQPVAAAVIDLSFLALLAAAVWREVVAGRNWRNIPVATMLSLLAVANLLHHLEAAGLVPPGLAIRLAFGVIVVLIALIGGRVVPSFTRNWLAAQGGKRLPASFGRLDRLALATTAAAAFLWIVLPQASISGALLLVAGGLLAARLSRWRGLATMRAPIVTILHAGYAWLALSLALIGLSLLAPGFVAPSTALHALSAGAIGTMTLAIMTRASLGHTGRSIVADRWTMAIYAAVSLGALMRVGAPYAGDVYLTLLAASGIVWSGAFAIFVLRYGPVLCRPRLQ